MRKKAKQNTVGAHFSQRKRAKEERSKAELQKQPESKF